MGSKHKLSPWIYGIIKNLEFNSALDGFSGSGVISYLLKSMGKTVYSNDFLHFSYLISKGIIENNEEILSPADVEMLVSKHGIYEKFISTTFNDIFYSKPELEFLDQISHNIQLLGSEKKRALAYTSLFRACLKKQPRGVFTVSGNLERYNDGRRDLQLTLEQHFKEQVKIYNKIIFNNDAVNISFNQDIFDFDNNSYKSDLVYLDPPYVPKSDDNCYVKRYHFLEGLSKYWEGEEIMFETKVKKIRKKYSPFSYRKSAISAFDNLFEKFSKSIIVLSYSSNAFPDLATLTLLIKKYKSDVKVFEKPHRYHF
jgi:DNA adenine methylase/adenine-specific DNA-methyltransferase